MSEYQVSVVEYPAKRLVGLKVRSSMQKAQIDCPALWQIFAPRMGELVADGGHRPSYGLSFMLNPEEFDYWATMEAGLAGQIPAGMESVDLPAGPYAKCAAPNLEQLGPAYMFLYDQWPKGQSTYAVCYEAPCFELYPVDWQFTAPFDIFMPLRKVCPPDRPKAG